MSRNIRKKAVNMIPDEISVHHPWPIYFSFRKEMFSRVTITFWTIYGSILIYTKLLKKSQKISVNSK